MGNLLSRVVSSETTSNGAQSSNADRSNDSHTADPGSSIHHSDTTLDLQEKKKILVAGATDKEADQLNESHTTDPDSSLQLSDTTLNLEQKKKILIEAAKKHYENRFNTLMPIPYMKDKNVCVNDVFVEVGADNYVTNPLLKKGAKWKRLSLNSNIFIDVRTQFKRRIITADAGCGKSTMTLQLAYDWCNGVKGSAFENVELLILLQLRQLGGLKSIYSAIKMILVSGDRRIKSSDIKSIIESCSSVEVLLDGYDEYPRMDKNNVSFVDRIIRSEMFENINVTLTSRYRPKDYDKLNTKLVRLVGLDDKARDQYIHKAFNVGDKENVAKIKQAIANNPILDDLCRIPLFLGMFTHLIHDGHDLELSRSVTNFFRYTIKCLHSHRRNKSLDENAVEYFTQYETEHSELNKLALEGLTKGKQLSWRKDELYKRIGRECCDHYLSVGVFVQEKEFDVINDTEFGNEGFKEIDVIRYYRKIFCEYYAAHGVVDLYNSGGSDKLQEMCNKMNPFDIQYVYRISCGIDPAVGKELISHLMSRRDCNSLVALCIMERGGDVTAIKKIVRQLCSNAVYLTNGDNRLLQRSTLHFLGIAPESDIPISSLILDESFKHVHENTIILRSGMTLRKLTTLEKLGIDTDPGTKLTEQDVVDLISYGKQSKIFKELRLYNYRLPLSMNFKPDTIPEELKSSDIKVMLPSSGHQLDLKNGKWVKATDVATITDLCSEYICIDNRTKVRLQKMTIELLKTASDKNIRISQLYLYECLKSVGKESITLCSDLKLTSLLTVETIGIETERGRNISEKEMLDLMSYAGKSSLLKNLSFYYQLLPRFVPVDSIPSELKSRKVSVHWFPNRKEDYYYKLNLSDGYWFKKSGATLNKEEYEKEEAIIKENNDR